MIRIELTPEEWQMILSSPSVSAARRGPRRLAAADPWDEDRGVVALENGAGGGV